MTRNKASVLGVRTESCLKMQQWAAKAQPRAVFNYIIKTLIVCLLLYWPNDLTPPPKHIEKSHFKTLLLPRPPPVYCVSLCTQCCTMMLLSLSLSLSL